jgi:hypothetical protein
MAITSRFHHQRAVASSSHDGFIGLARAQTSAAGAGMLMTAKVRGPRGWTPCNARQATFLPVSDAREGLGPLSPARKISDTPWQIPRATSTQEELAGTSQALGPREFLCSAASTPRP